MWKMWKPAWIAAYLRLKMWKIDLKVWKLWEQETLWHWQLV